jgi:hypothetical protein
MHIIALFIVLHLTLKFRSHIKTSITSLHLDQVRLESHKIFIFLTERIDTKYFQRNLNYCLTTWLDLVQLLFTACI